jgi:flagellar export protein FliJ
MVRFLTRAGARVRNDKGLGEDSNILRGAGMAFRFGLQSVLHFRQSVEHQQELRLRLANQQVARVQHLVDQLNARRRELYAGQARDLGMGLTAAELQFELQCDTELLRHKRELETQLAKLQQLRGHQRVIFQQARRARQTLESVRDRQLQAYRQEAERREQRDLDDLFLLRREYLRRG